MSNFRTTLKLVPSDTKIGLNQSILTLGSCFADTMGSRLEKFKLDTLSNPFGVLFNPVSIHHALGRAITNTPILADSLFQNQEVFYHYDFHSDFSSLEASELSSQINNAIDKSHTHLQKANWLLITYGTAWVYVLKTSNQVVANCHKMPDQLFTKSLLDEQSVVESFSTLYSSLRKINPDVQIILTVSPVRHLKDTLELNTVSKSILRLACHRICTTYQDVHYFPAFEIMMDDLRDYRFYNADMIHPTAVAEEYIWDQFLTCFADEKTNGFMKQWSQVLKDLAHKPFHSESSAHQQFLLKLKERIESLSTVVNVDQELRQVKNQLINPMK